VKLTRKRLDGPGLGGLLATRQGAVTLALVCGLAATGILIFAIGKYRHAVSGPAKQDTVLVATSVIQKGTAAGAIATGQLYKVTPVLDTQVSPGAITNAASLVGKITASTILTGQQLTAADFTTGPVGLTATLSPTERAISLTLDPAHGSAGLQTGDHVDVYASVANPTPLVSLLVPDAVVLRAPSTSATGSANTSGGGTVLLGVSMQLSPRVMWVFDNGKIWLELRGLNASNPDATVTSLRQLVLGNHLAVTPTYAAASRTAAKR
jgi:Flp pilus assembly protein CpaB